MLDGSDITKSKTCIHTSISQLPENNIPDEAYNSISRMLDGDKVTSTLWANLRIDGNSEFQLVDNFQIIADYMKSINEDNSNFKRWLK